MEYITICYKENGYFRNNFMNIGAIILFWKENKFLDS